MADEKTQEGAAATPPISPYTQELKRIATVVEKTLREELVVSKVIDDTTPALVMAMVLVTGMLARSTRSSATKVFAEEFLANIDLALDSVEAIAQAVVRSQLGKPREPR